MKFYFLTAFMVLALTTLSYGEQDNRLHSPTAVDSLTIPNGYYQGLSLDVRKLKQFIPLKLHQVSEAFDFSIERKNIFGFLSKEFNILFSVKTTPHTDSPNTSIHTDIVCICWVKTVAYEGDGRPHAQSLVLEDCKNEDVRFAFTIEIPFKDILVRDNVARRFFKNL